MKFLKNLTLYTFVGVLGAGINFLIMPVLSHYLSPADYGLLSLFNTYVTILIPFAGLVANALLSIEYFKEKNKEVFASKFTSIQLIPVITSTILAILVMASYSSLRNQLELQGTSVVWGFILVLLAFCNIYVEHFLNFLVIEKRAGYYGIFSGVKIVLEVGLTLYFVVVQRMGWEGRIWSWLITSVLYFIISVFYFHRQGYLFGRLRLAFIKEGIIFGLPLILHTVGKFVINQSDRLFIAKMISVDEAGIYNMGYTIGMLILIVINAFFSYYTPFLMERLADLTEEKKLQIVKMNYIYIAGIFLTLLVITLLTPLLFRYFIDERYVSAIRYVFWVGLGYCFWGGYMLFSSFISFYKKNRILGWMAIFNVATNIIFNYLFIKQFGAIGAAYATCLSFFFTFIIVSVVTHKLLPLPWLSFNKIKAASLY